MTRTRYAVGRFIRLIHFSIVSGILVSVLFAWSRFR